MTPSNPTAQLVYLALGSNLADPKRQIEQAISALQSLTDSQLHCSSFYRTAPMGAAGQADYLNAVVAFTTQLTPAQLLAATQQIEQQQGRVRTDQRWGPRTLDIDILLFGSLKLNNDTLTIPHYDMHNRLFMLYPLYEIAPDLVLPNGIALADYLQRNYPNQQLAYW